MHYRSATASLVILFVAFLGLVGSPSIGRAESATRFDLPAEPLDQALRDFAIQAKCNISYEPAAVRGLQAPAIKGNYSASDVLKLLLKGTQLHGVHVNDDTIQVLQSSNSRSVDSPSSAGSSEPSNPDMVHFDYAAPDGPASVTPTTTSNADQGSTTDNNAPDRGLAEIVVTGTNIHGVDNKTVPLLTFDRDSIERSGFATTEDFIDSLPQNVKSAGNSADGVLTGSGLSNIESSTAPNLRGLGASSTLTLINGHRVAGAAYGSGVDLSMIPLSAVERIEVLTDGSSAVYGSDAVGGVVNIILRKDFNGAESSVRLDTLTQGGGEQKQVGQTFGRTWDQGGALAVLQFQDSNTIGAQQRAATRNLPEPTDVYPSAKRYSGVFSGHQNLGSSLELFTDALLEHDDGFRAYNTGGDFSSIQLLSNKTNSTSADAGLRWQPFGDWRLEGNTLFSQMDTAVTGQFSPPAYRYTNGDPYLRNLYTIKEADLKLDGTLWSSGGSSIKAAAGGSYRREDFSSLVPFEDDNRATSRHVSAAFAEFYAPLITSANAVALVQKLELSAAVRHDAYSDFGAKTNPRLGMFWSPISELGVRIAYSTSFRAPNPIETLTALSANTVYIYSDFPLPNGTTGNAFFFGNQTLTPETSRNLTIGLDFEPSSLPSTRLSLNYYRIDYSNRIIGSPTSPNVFVDPQVYGPLVKTFTSDAAVEAFVAALEPPQMLADYTDGGTGLAGVRYGFPYGEINAPKEITEGLDLGAHTLLTLSGNNKLLFDLNATYIKEMNTAYCIGCTSVNLVNTYGEPLKFRARAASGWSNGALSANAAVNFQNAYSDTDVLPSDTGFIPGGRISSWTTADVNIGYRFAGPAPITLALSVINLFDANPPRTAPALNNITYDPTNADPRGRSVSLQARVQW